MSPFSRAPTERLRIVAARACACACASACTTSAARCVVEGCRFVFDTLVWLQFRMLAFGHTSSLSRIHFDTFFLHFGTFYWILLDFIAF
jgi:hypothetical protein